MVQGKAQGLANAAAEAVRKMALDVEPGSLVAFMPDMQLP
jgi:hypothetical protein